MSKRLPPAGCGLLFTPDKLCKHCLPQIRLETTNAWRGGLDLELRRRLGESVRQLRALQGLSQEELAERAGLHWTQVQRIEQAKLNPTLETLESLARGLGVPAAKLLDGVPDEKSSTVEALLGLLAGCTERERNLVLQVTKCILSNLPEPNSQNEGSE